MSEPTCVTPSPAARWWCSTRRGTARTSVHRRPPPRRSRTSSAVADDEGGREDAHRAFVEALLADDAMRLYDRSPCGYLSTTPDGLIVKVNQTLLTWTGFGREELVGTRRFADLLNAGGRIYHETHYAPMLRLQDHVREIALDIVRADGQPLPVLVNAVLDRDEGGSPVVVRIALFDATERR